MQCSQMIYSTIWLIKMRIELAVEAFTPKMVSFLDTMRENDVSIIHLQLINLEDDPKAERYGDFYQSQRDLKVQKSYLSFFMKRYYYGEK